MHSIVDIKRTIPQHFRQAATEYEKGNDAKALKCAYMAIDAVDTLKQLEIEAVKKIEAASGACEEE